MPHTHTHTHRRAPPPRTCTRSIQPTTDRLEPASPASSRPTTTGGMPGPGTLLLALVVVVSMEGDRSRGTPSFPASAAPWCGIPTRPRAPPSRTRHAFTQAMRMCATTPRPALRECVNDRSVLGALPGRPRCSQRNREPRDRIEPTTDGLRVSRRHKCVLRRLSSTTLLLLLLLRGAVVTGPGVGLRRVVVLVGRPHTRRVPPRVCVLLLSHGARCSHVAQ